MAVIETWLRQDLVSLVSVQNLSGHIFTQDNQGNRIGVEVTKNGVPVELSGTCTGYVIRSDGKTVVMYGEIDGNKASILLPAACYAIVGNVNIVLKVGETTLLACTGYVYRTTTDTIVDPGTVVPDITELLDKIDEMEQGTAAAVAAAEAIEDMTVEAEDGGAVNAVITDVDGHKHIAFTIPSANSKAPAILKSVSGDIVTLDDGADGVPLKECVVQIDPVQDGSGDPSPENIRPLIGLDGCTIFRVGTPVNLFDGQMEPGEISTTTGENSGSSTSRSRSVNYIPYREGLGSLYFHCPEREGNFRIYYYGAAKNYIGYNSVTANAAVTIPQGLGIRYLRFRFGSGAIADDQYISVNVPSTATGYIPHAVQTYPVSWQTAAGTVYGGTLNPVTGVLTVTKKSVDLGSLTWKGVTCNGSTTKYYMRATLADCKEAESNSVIGDVICEQYRATSFNVVYGGNTDLRIALSSSNHRICIYDAAYNTAESESAFASAMNGVHAVYGLETPQTYQLDPVTVTTLLGQNNIWADTGAASVTYPADTQTYIDESVANAKRAGNEQIAPVEDTTTATRDYQAGDLFILNDILYKATALIVTGDIIYPGINASETTVEELIDEVTTDIDGIIDDTAGDGDTDKTWSADKLFDISDDVGGLKSGVDGKAPVILGNVSGDIVSLSDGADGMPLKECVVQIDPVQSGTGDPSPENVRSISGHDSCTICRTGRNLYDYLTAVSGSYYSLSDGVVSISRAYGTGGTTMPSFVLYAIGGQTVTLSADVRMTKDADDDRNIVRIGFKADGVTGGFNHNYDATLTAYDTWTRISNTFTLGTYTEWRVGLQPRYTGHTLQFRNVQVEFGSVANDYTPYTGTAYPISWQTAAGTVYGGTVDLEAQTLTVDALATDMGTLSWNYVSTTTYPYFYAALPAPARKRATGTYGVSLCEIYKPIPNQTAANFTEEDHEGEICINSGYAGGYRVIVQDSNYTDADTFKTAVTGKILVAPVAQGIVYQLDPVQITALKESNIWADTGAVSLTYPSDTRTYIDNAISTATDPDGNIVTVTGSTPSITGESGKRYVCGTVDSISITPPSTGIIDVIFTSGTTPAVLTIPNTVRFPAWFDPTSLDASTTYEINVQDGIYGAVMMWT